MSHSLKGATTATSCNENRNDDEETDSLSLSSPNIIVISGAGKPIYSRYGDENDLAQTCALVQVLLATTASLDDDDDENNEKEEIKFIRAGDMKIAFLTIGDSAMTLLAVSYTGDETEAFLHMQLEYVYAQILFTLTDQVQNILETNPNFDLRDLLGATDTVMEGILDEISSIPTFITSGVETTCPIPIEIRENVSRILHAAGNQIPNIVYAIVTVGRKLVTMVQPKKNEHQIRGMDLHLILNFVDRQPGLLTSGDSWLPLCLPHLHPSSFVYAYTSCLNIDSGLTLVLVSTQSTSEQFLMFRTAGLIIKSSLGLEDDEDRKTISDDDRKVIERFQETIGLSGFSGGSGGSSNGSSREGNKLRFLVGGGNANDYSRRGNNYQTSDLSSSQTPVTAKNPLVEAVIKAPSELCNKLDEYCKFASVFHFLFRRDIPIHSGNGSSSSSSCSRKLSHCINSTFQIPLENDAGSQRRVMNVYQRLALRLRYGSCKVEATMNAFDQFHANEANSVAYDEYHYDNGHSTSATNYFPAQGIFKEAPKIHGVTYMTDGYEMFMALNGKNFELYAVLPSMISPPNATSLCARLIRKLMSDEHMFLITKPLTWD
mmetsp:Transcript_49136/g.59278  ORF Transcript_49136/g.59278 Transcript_49136/m.59278 type:complete len:602 (-) Transcript_49136:248-2053(-)